jgi:hypothetical protein
LSFLLTHCIFDQDKSGNGIVIMVDFASNTSFVVMLTVTARTGLAKVNAAML